MEVRHIYEIRGVVQGVGFRPALFRLAMEAGLSGHVQNRTGHVQLVLEGPEALIRNFIADLPRRLPSNARVSDIRLSASVKCPPSSRTDSFRIVESDTGDPVGAVLPPDFVTCPACLSEIFQPANRRHGYPFTTCTDCGPRYTLVETTPYDRERTSMNQFPLCADCRREYTDPFNRRFHAESLACPRCGPRLRLEDASRRPVAGDALREARRRLADGAILAIRGIGGFLLAADATSPPVLQRLRERKHRPDKPLAVMADSLETIRSVCELSPVESDMLASNRGPIVILSIRPEAGPLLPLHVITPDSRTLGVMLPTSPLHHLLFRPLAGDPVAPFRWLVMTSGNRGGEPICITNDEAHDRLAGIADGFLLHDREIRLRNDDSIAVAQCGAPQVWRRARGYAPLPVRLSRPLSRCVLGMGAEIKNAVALGFGDQVVLSPHVGDLETPEAVAGLESAAASLPRFFARRPDCVAVDLHPDMHSTIAGREIAAALGIPAVEVQHHAAHAMACMAEHGCPRALALVLDGTGMGTDHTIWGAELLHVENGQWSRLATFQPAPLPGGDAAVRHPIRQLAGRWIAAGYDASRNSLQAAGISESQWSVWKQQCNSGLNTPLSRSAGRVFDAFSALLGLAPSVVTYEGQAAIRLEAAAMRFHATPAKRVPYRTVERDGMFLVDWAEAFSDPPETPCADTPEWAAAFHQSMAKACLDMVEYGLSRTAVRTVALSGGVFMNRLLNQILVPALTKKGVPVLMHRDTPPNDGGIALGQVVAAGGATPCA
jgi:hydrogenase maturation protein HypF